MITIYYCKINNRVLYACNKPPVSVECDKHPNDACEIKISDIDEPNFTGKKLIMSDGTEINDSDSYLEYLKKYIPL